MIIKNRPALIDNRISTLEGYGRELVLASFEAALAAAEPRQIVRAKVRREGSLFSVAGQSFDLRDIGRLVVIGGGKATGAMAEAIEDIFGDRLSCGTINVPYGVEPRLKTIRFRQAGHPIPDREGELGAQEMLALAEQATQRDLLLVLTSGGGSSLLPVPHKEITLRDKQILTERFLLSGAPIEELNTVRKHISGIKGGWLARAAAPATVLNLVISDVIGDRLDVIASGPTSPDPSTFAEAIAVLRSYDIWERTPLRIKLLLQKGMNKDLPETPKEGDACFSTVFSAVIGNNRTATEAMQHALAGRGIAVMILPDPLRGEAREAGARLGAGFAAALRPGSGFKRPFAVIAGGETTVRISESSSGSGGRNQELALALAQQIAGLPGVVAGTLGTDGVDGPTEAAGAVIDGMTLLRAGQAGLRPDEALRTNDSGGFFQALGDRIMTGPTGTNVNDVAVLIAV
jgi:glycerate 2-kinase